MCQKVWFRSKEVFVWKHIEICKAPFKYKELSLSLWLEVFPFENDHELDSPEISQLWTSNIIVEYITFLTD